MGQGDNLNTLLSRLFQTKDPLLAKMLRNISQHDGETKHKFAEFVSDIAALARQTEDPNLLVELLGILGNMTLTDIPFAQVRICFVSDRYVEIFGIFQKGALTDVPFDQI